MLESKPGLWKWSSNSNTRRSVHSHFHHQPAPYPHWALTVLVLPTVLHMLKLPHKTTRLLLRWMSNLPERKTVKPSSEMSSWKSQATSKKGLKLETGLEACALKTFNLKYLGFLLTTAFFHKRNEMPIYFTGYWVCFFGPQMLCEGKKKTWVMNVSKPRLWLICIRVEWIIFRFPTTHL